MAAEYPTIWCNCRPAATEQYHVDSNRTPVEAISVALLEASEGDIGDLPRLYEAIDPGAINRLFNGEGKYAEAADARLSFSVEKWNVFIRSDGRILVCDATRATEIGPAFDKSIV